MSGSKLPLPLRSTKCFDVKSPFAERGSISAAELFEPEEQQASATTITIIVVFIFIIVIIARSLCECSYRSFQKTPVTRQDLWMLSFAHEGQEMLQLPQKLFFSFSSFF